MLRRVVLTGLCLWTLTAVCPCGESHLLRADDKRPLAAQVTAAQQPTAQQPTTEKPASDKPSAMSPTGLTAAEQQFVNTLTNAVMEGHFTTLNNPDGGGKPERYVVQQVTKLMGDNWLILARITYGKHDAVAPVPVKVRFAGDTPMIQLTDVGVPGFGTFTARVLIHGDRYAGTWQHDDHGGHLWGTIRQLKAGETLETKPAETSPPGDNPPAAPGTAPAAE